MRKYRVVVAVALVFGLTPLARAQSLGKGLAVTGKVNVEDFRKTLEKSVGQLARCWDELKKSKPDASGRVEIAFRLEASGKTSGLRLTGAPTFDTASFKKCVGDVIAAWKLPHPESGTAAIVIPVLFGVDDPALRDTALAVAEQAKEKPTKAENAPPAAPAASESKDDETRASGGSRHAAATDSAPRAEPSAAPAHGAVASSGSGSPPPSPGAEPHKAAAKKAKPTDAKAGASEDRSAATPGTAPAEPTSVPVAKPERERDSAPPRRAVSAPAMKAGRYDDNKQYNRFVDFLSENERLVVYPVDVSERLLVHVLDKDGKSLHNCGVDVTAQDGKVLATSTTYADGATQFFPAAYGPKDAKDYVVAARCGKDTRKGQLARNGRRITEVRFENARSVPARVPVDVAIVLDTTGSMQGQIDRLKTTLQAIHFQLTSLSTKPDIRFGLVAYRDRGDDYITKVWGFTDKVDDFQKVVDGLAADGGGDTPEDMQAALDAAMHQLEWRKDAVRVGFVISDAIPHTNYGQAYSYREAMREGLARGIKWVTVGAGGLGRDGEVIYRQIAQFTMGEYVFITEGAQGDAEGGAGEASHHVGTNYLVENLDQAIVRIVRRELSYLTDSPREVDDTIAATGPKGTPRDEVLAPAVAEVMRQLVDYSSMQLGNKTPVCVVPVTAEATYKDVAGYLSDQFALVASRTPTFKLVERDLQALAAEQKLQLSDLFDVTETVPIGKLIGADVLVVAKLITHGDDTQLVAKLVRVETGEVLSVAKVRITGGVI